MKLWNLGGCVRCPGMLVVEGVNETRRLPKSFSTGNEQGQVLN